MVNKDERTKRSKVINAGWDKHRMVNNGESTQG